MRFCSLCVLISIFSLSVKVSSVFGMTQHKGRCFGFWGFFSNSTCLLCNDFLICTLPRYNYWKEREKLLGMSCYAKLRIISSYFLCNLMD
ncbi:hypothetical protein RLOC_00006102 [Lonchura striata]|uniref:Secreted protein n=1 Tax=Lonchura striata TaxID=40157 RepID=A0A218UY03_9PASE|nr:hypothetical protein RLOC_00006102 [Lonchura striata domestica]